MKKIIALFKTFWDGLPKELKVGLYLIVSYFLSDFVVLYLKSLDVRLALVAANIILVFAVEMRGRVDTIREKINGK